MSEFLEKKDWEQAKVQAERMMKDAELTMEAAKMMYDKAVDEMGNCDFLEECKDNLSGGEIK